MLFSKNDKNKFNLSKEISMRVGEETLKFRIKPLPVNFQDTIAEELPYPDMPKVFNKAKKQFEHRETPQWETDRKKIDSLRTYAVFVLGVEDEIEGTDLKDKIETLLDTGLPIGYFIEAVKEIQTLSGITDSEFQSGL